MTQSAPESAPAEAGADHALRAPAGGTAAPGGSLADAEDRDLVALVQSQPIGTAIREEACAVLVERYESLVRSCALRYRESPEPQEELMQVGYVGLLKAINNFDPAIGESLAAYAQPCVSGEIKRYFRDRRWQIHVRRATQELRLRIRKAHGELTQHLQRTVTQADLADHLGVSLAELLDAQHAEQAFQAASLSAPLSDGADASVLAELIGDSDEHLETSVAMSAVWEHLAELPEREQRLVLMRFYGNMTQSQIGAQLGISQMHVSRLLGHALGYLRERIAEPGGEAEAG
ncbi:MAG: sigma-70 family RNA polymerase sigma factor [Streptosporangiaceae bacterium]